MGSRIIRVGQLHLYLHCICGYCIVLLVRYLQACATSSQKVAKVMKLKKHIRWVVRRQRFHGMRAVESMIVENDGVDHGGGDGCGQWRFRRSYVGKRRRRVGGQCCDVSGKGKADGVDCCGRNKDAAGMVEQSAFMNHGADRRFRRTHATNGRARGIAKVNYAAYNWLWDGRAQAYVWACGRKASNRKMHALNGNVFGNCTRCRQVLNRRPMSTNPMCHGIILGSMVCVAGSWYGGTLVVASRSRFGSVCCRGVADLLFFLCG